MVTEITCYRDSAGTIHQSACNAHRAELLIWLMQTDSMNEASAKRLADRMVEQSAELKKLIETINQHCPRGEEPAPARQAMERNG